MAGFRSITPSISVNTSSGQLRTELLNTFTRLDGQLALAPYRLGTASGPIGNSAGVETTLESTTVSQGTLSKSESSILIFACWDSQDKLHLTDSLDTVLRHLYPHTKSNRYYCVCRPRPKSINNHYRRGSRC